MNRHILTTTALLCLLAATPGRAGTCTVPGTHALIQDAVDDLACNQIELAAQTYAESLYVSRSLAIAGPAPDGAVLEGQLLAVGNGVEVAVSALTASTSCTPAVDARSGARVDGSGLVAVVSSAAPCSPHQPIFTDGFESGDTGGWSATTP